MDDEYVKDLLKQMCDEKTRTGEICRSAVAALTRDQLPLLLELPSVEQYLRNVTSPVLVVSACRAGDPMEVAVRNYLVIERGFSNIKSAQVDVKRKGTNHITVDVKSHNVVSRYQLFGDVFPLVIFTDQCFATGESFKAVSLLLQSHGYPKESIILQLLFSSKIAQAMLEKEGYTYISVVKDLNLNEKNYLIDTEGNLVTGDVGDNCFPVEPSEVLVGGIVH